MSTKSTIFLTENNEHCYTDCNEPVFKDGDYIGDAIYLQMSKENISIIENDYLELIIKIDPGSELYELIKMMKN